LLEFLVIHVDCFGLAFGLSHVSYIALNESLSRYQ
jgi:hypothetical protein